MPTTERVLTLWGRRVSYLDVGTGPPLVVVHGLGLSGRFWVDHIPAFRASGVRIIAPDLPGFGGSEGPLFGYDVVETADWLLSFAAALGLRSPIWLGHSLGTQPVMDLAARSPGSARALILASPTGASVRLRWVHQLWNYFRDIRREPCTLVPLVARDYLRSSPLCFLGTWLKALSDAPDEKADRIECPTLLVVGMKDPVVPSEYLEGLRRRIRRSRLVVLPGGAHGVVFDRSRTFDRVVAGFLEEIAAG